MTEHARGRSFVRKRFRFPTICRWAITSSQLEIGGDSVAAIAPDRLPRIAPIEPAWLGPAGPPGLAVSLYGVRSAAQLGLRRLPPICEALIDWVAERPGRQLRRAESAARHSQPAAVQHQPLSAELDLLPESHLSGRRSDRGLSVFARAPSGCSQSAAVQTEIAALRAAELVEYERVYRAQAALPEAAVSCISARNGAETRRARANFEALHRARRRLLHRFAVHSRAGRCHPQTLTPTSGTGAPGREQYQDPESPADAEHSRKNIGAAFCFTNTCSGSSICNSQRRSKHAAERGFSIGLYHDLALATDRFGSDLWAHRAFSSPAAAWARRPTISRPRARTGRFPPPNSERHCRRRLSAVRRIDPQELPARRRAAHRSRHALLPPVLDSRRHGRHRRHLRARPLRGPGSHPGAGKRAQKVVVIGEDLGTVPDDVREALAALRHSQLPAVLFRAGPERPLPPPREYPRAGAGLGHHARSAHAGRLLDGRRY